MHLAGLVPRVECPDVRVPSWSPASGGGEGKLLIRSHLALLHWEPLIKRGVPPLPYSSSTLPPSTQLSPQRGGTWFQIITIFFQKVSYEKTPKNSDVLRVKTSKRFLNVQRIPSKRTWISSDLAQQLTVLTVIMESKLVDWWPIINQFLETVAYFMLNWSSCAASTSDGHVTLCISPTERTPWADTRRPSAQGTCPDPLGAEGEFGKTVTPHEFDSGDVFRCSGSSGVANW